VRILPDRFDVRLQYETLPDMGKFHEEFDNRYQETLTLWTDLVLFQKPDQIGLRVDLPIVWNNNLNTENRLGKTQSGFGDLLFQSIYAHTFNDHWAAGIGTRWMFPTATGGQNRLFLLNEGQGRLGHVIHSQL
jgi:hypothetical protein